jgi:hypothetical protein
MEESKSGTADIRAISRMIQLLEHVGFEERGDMLLYDTATDMFAIISPQGECAEFDELCEALFELHKVWSSYEMPHMSYVRGAIQYLEPLPALRKQSLRQRLYSYLVRLIGLPL